MHVPLLSESFTFNAVGCRELEDLHSGAIRKGPLPDSRPEGTASPQEGDLVSNQCSY